MSSRAMTSSENRKGIARTTNKPIAGGNKTSMVSFSRARESLMKDGIHTIVSLSETELAPEVEDMASEFTNITRGSIDSMVSPLRLKMKESEGSQKVVLTNLQKMSTFMNKLRGHNYPFYRIDKVKMLYVPLFNLSLAEGEHITFSLIDTSVVDESKQEMSSVTVPLNSMSMSEMSMAFFVPSGNIGSIELAYKSGNVPVAGRSYAFLMLAFYIHGDFAPAAVREQESLSLLIDCIDAPENINTTSSISKLIEKVQHDVRMKKQKMGRRSINYARKSNSLKRGLLIEEPEAENDEAEMSIDDAESFSRAIGDIPTAPLLREKDFDDISVNSLSSSVSALSISWDIDSCPQMRKEDISRYLPRSLPFVKKAEMILDTGAPNHWFYNPKFSGDQMFENKTGEPTIHADVSYSKVPGAVEVKLGIYWVRLHEVYYGRANDIPLISYSRLVADNIIDSLKEIDDGSAALCKGPTIVFTLVKSDHGRYVFLRSTSTSSTVLGSLHGPDVI